MFSWLDARSLARRADRSNRFRSIEIQRRKRAGEIARSAASDGVEISPKRIPFVVPERSGYAFALQCLEVSKRLPHFSMSLPATGQIFSENAGAACGKLPAVKHAECIQRLTFALRLLEAQL